MKESLIPLNFTTTPTIYDTKQSFSTSDEASGVLTFTTTADVAGTVASLTIRNASENANRQTVRIERLDDVTRGRITNRRHEEIERDAYNL